MAFVYDVIIQDTYTLHKKSYPIISTLFLGDTELDGHCHFIKSTGKKDTIYI